MQAQSKGIQTLDALLAELNAALQRQDTEAVAALFGGQAYWRDLVMLTWNIHTAEGQGAIAEMLRAQLPMLAPLRFARDVNAPVTRQDGVLAGWFHIDSRDARGVGHVRVRDGKIWTLLTRMNEIKGHEESVGPRRPKGVEHGSRKNRLNWLQAREQESAELGTRRQPYVLIVGGGQGGIGLAARLRQLGVPTLVVDRHARPGDSWRTRYKSLCLHDPVWYDHMPYLPFPPNWPVFTPKDKMGDWLEMYVRVMELNYWTATVCQSACYDDDARAWQVQVERDGQPVTLRPKHLVLATGMSGKPNVPKFPGQDVFAGEQQHSSQHPGPDAYAGRRVVVIGSNNSAHDICAALWEAGADVTMVQRSPTLVVRSETLMEIGFGALYSEQALAAGITTEKADLIYATTPYRLMPQLQIPLWQKIRARDADFYQKLQAAGFMLDWGEDESGLALKYLRRGSGYYIDVGACDLVIDGSIKLASGSEVSHLTKDAVVLQNGKTLPADLVVYATGYGSMNGWAADLISQAVADKVGKCWGLGSGTAKDPGPWEGELRNMWKPTQQEALWFHGGNLHQSRHYSQYLSLQLKARQIGLPVQVYGLAPVHHRE